VSAIGKSEKEIAEERIYQEFLNYINQLKKEKNNERRTEAE
jgi:hypothetical protein